MIPHATLLSFYDTWRRGQPRQGPSTWDHLRGGAIALGSSLLAALLTQHLQPLLAPRRFLLFIAAVVVSAWYGRFPAGLLATALGSLGHLWLLYPVGFPARVDRENWMALALFVPVGLLLSWLVGALRAAQHRAKCLAQALAAQVRELAEAARHKDEFLAVLSHELRNPLAATHNALALLHRCSDATTVQAARAVLERQAGHISRLAEELLDNSRIARGKIVLHRQRVDLVRLVRDVLNDHDAQVTAAGLTLRRELPDKPGWIEGDPTRLSQVVGNLLQNAVKLTDPGGQVTVRLTLEAAHRRAVVTVQDTGMGIEPSLLPCVFETYVQGPRSLGPSRDGLGLGLALVKALVELHGGGVQVRSNGLGRGAEFSCWLPMVSDAP